MGNIIGSAPVLLVSDVVASANYYRDRVGFTYDRFWGEPPNFCILRRGEAHIMLSQVEDAADIRPNWKVVDNTWNIYFWVDNVEDFYADVKARGVNIDYELGPKHYGCLEFGIQDLDGYDIAFGQIIDE